MRLLAALAILMAIPDISAASPRLPMLRRDWSARSLEDPRTELARRASQILREHYGQREQFRYEGATAGRRVHGWYAGAADANVELMGALIWLRDRSRDLIRNNPYACKAIEELVGNTVGTGISPQAGTGNTDIDKIIDAEWPYFADNCDPGKQMDFYGIEALTTRTMAESGES